MLKFTDGEYHGPKRIFWLAIGGGCGEQRSPRLPTGRRPAGCISRCDDRGQAAPNRNSNGVSIRDPRGGPKRAGESLQSAEGILATRQRTWVPDKEGPRSFRFPERDLPRSVRKSQMAASNSASCLEKEPTADVQHPWLVMCPWYSISNESLFLRAFSR